MSTANTKVPADAISSDSSGYQWAIWCLGILIAFGLIAMIISALVLSLQNRNNCGTGRRDMVDTSQLRDGAVTFPKLDSTVSAAILAGGGMNTIQIGVIPMVTDSVLVSGPVNAEVTLAVPAATSDYNVISLTECTLYTSEQTALGFKCTANPVYTKQVRFPAYDENVDANNWRHGSGMSLSAMPGTVTWATLTLTEQVDKSTLSFWGVALDSDDSFPLHPISSIPITADFDHDPMMDISMHYGPALPDGSKPSYSCIMLGRKACLVGDCCTYVQGDSITATAPTEHTIKLYSARVLEYANYKQTVPLGIANRRYLDWIETESGFVFLKISTNVSDYTAAANGTPKQAQLTALVAYVPALPRVTYTTFCDNSSDIITGDRTTPTSPSFVTTALLPQTDTSIKDQIVMCQVVPQGTPEKQLNFKVLQIQPLNPPIKHMENIVVTYEEASATHPDFGNIATACCFGATKDNALALYVLWSAAEPAEKAGKLVLVRYSFDAAKRKFGRDSIMLNEATLPTALPQQMAIEEVDDPWSSGAGSKGVQLTCYNTGRLQIIGHGGVTGGRTFLTRPAVNTPLEAFPLFIPDASATPKACILNFGTHLSKESGSPLAYIIN